MEDILFLGEIAKEFPTLKWKKYKNTTNGYDHYVIILDNELVFRIPKGKEYADRLMDEVRLLSYLHKKTEINIPHYTCVSKNKPLAGYPIIKGKILTPVLFKKLSSADKKSIATQLAGFISLLHKTPKSIVKKYNVAIRNEEIEFKNLVRDVKKYVFPRLSKKEIEQIELYFEELKIAQEHVQTSVLTHNDLISEHLFWDHKDKKVGLIDFSDRTFDDPAMDFTGLWVFGKKFVEQVYSLYTGKKDPYLLDRSILYYKRTPLSIMKTAIKGQKSVICTFEYGYELFKKRWG